MNKTFALLLGCSVLALNLSAPAFAEDVLGQLPPFQGPAVAAKPPGPIQVVAAEVPKAQPVPAVSAPAPIPAVSAPAGSAEVPAAVQAEIARTPAATVQILPSPNAPGRSLPAETSSAQVESQVQAQAEPVTLKTLSTVTGPKVTLGDLFDNAGKAAGDVVAAAPAAGANSLFGSSWLYTTAKAHGLDWTPPSDQTSIRVERASNMVETAEVARQLAAQLAPNEPNHRVELDNQLRLYIPVEDTADIAVQNVDLRAQNGRFSAYIKVPASDPNAVPVRVTGRLVATLEVPVLNRPMLPGDTIRQEDISVAAFRTDQIPAGQATDPRDLIGHTPRHPINAQQPLRLVDVQMPVLVKRGDLVMIVVETPGMSLTAMGKALEEGGMGTAIRVTNTQSNRTIDAVVVGIDRVGVRVPGMQQASAQ